MEIYLKLFEEAIQKQAEVVGAEIALEHAKKAGLGVSKDGRIVSCVGDPQVVLLKLIKFFATSGSLKALSEVSALINEVLEKGSSKEDEQEKTTSEV